MRGAMATCWEWLTMLLFVVSSASVAAASTRPSDVYALQRLLRNWQENTEVLKNWSLLKDADPCGFQWEGVNCCHLNTVTSLDLSSAGVVGSIPAEIGDLQNLRHLDLSNNPLLSGDIPEGIANLRQLNFLNLSGCGFSGVIPQFLSSTSNLKVLDLSNNPTLHSIKESQYFNKLSKGAPRPRSTPSSRRLSHYRTLFQTVPPIPPTGTPSPSPPPFRPPAPPTPVRIHLMYVGIAAFCLALLSAAVFCLCRKFGQQKVGGAQRLPPLPRYH